MSEAVATQQQGLAGKYCPYSEYKDSGIEWLGIIPSEWQKMPLKRYCKVVSGYAFPSEMFIDSGLPVVRIGDIKSDGSVVLDDCKYIEVQNSHLYSRFAISSGELLMAMTGATIGKAGWFKSDTKAFLNQRVGSFRVSDCFEYKFLWYVLNSSGYQEYIQLTAFGGAQPNISDTGMLAYETAYPTINEQRTIAAFLDYETAQIDQLIAKQQQLIELLKEKRQAVISHAVTKGLNSDAPMKDSGVEWLGQVPEHWQVVKLSYVMALKSGDGITSLEIEEVGEYPVYGGNGLRGYYNKYNCDGHYALIGRQGALCGNVNIAEGRFYASEHAVVVYPYQNIDTNFLAEFLRYMDLGQYSVSAAQPGLSVERINMLKIALPPLLEQNKIGQYVVESDKQIQQLINRAQMGVSLLQERRIALISAAVTGKIDLRGWTSPVENVAA